MWKFFDFSYSLYEVKLVFFFFFIDPLHGTRRPKI